VFTFGLGTVLRSIEHYGGVSVFGANATATPAPNAKIFTYDHTPVGSVPWATGAAVCVMMYSLGNISCHFNPAVTLGVVLSGRSKCSVWEGLTLMAVQAGAAITAVATYTCVRGANGLLNVDRIEDLGPRPGFKWYTVGMTEVFFTMGITLIFLCVTTLSPLLYSKAPRDRCFQLGLTVGMSVSAAMIALDNISGGYLNPAISFGVSIENFVCGGWHFTMHPLGNRARYLAWYLIYEFSGGVAAALLFALIHRREYKKDMLLAGQALPTVYRPRRAMEGNNSLTSSALPTC
jgi:glycerol uptake facilitator-like aquaporin